VVLNEHINSDLSLRIDKCFRQALAKDFRDEDLLGLEFKVTREWDSVSHIKLMSALRDEFSIKFSFEDMVKMISYSEVIRVVGRHVNS